MRTTKTIAKKAMYAGAVAGVAAFVAIGLLPSSFVGGLVGLKIAGSIFGTSLGVAVLPRIVVGLTMVLGVLIAASVFTLGAAVIGWLAGHTVDLVRAQRTVGVNIEAKGKA